MNIGSSDGFETIGKKLGLDKSHMFASRSDAKLSPAYYSSRGPLKSYSELK